MPNEPVPVPIPGSQRDPPARRRGFGWLLCGGWIDRSRANSIFDTDSWEGLFGRYPTLLAAYLWCFCVSWPVTAVEIAGIPLMLCTAIRMHRNYRYIPSILFQPLLLAVAAFGAVQFISGWWTQDRAQWLQQAGTIRWLWSLFMLWPLIEHRRGLIIATALGCVVGNATQISQFLHVHLHWQTPTWPRAEDRISGWWPPVVCGTILTAALGLHLPSLLLPGRPRARVLASICAALTLACIFASGTRGAWVASMALILICVPAAILIRRRSSLAFPANGVSKRRSPLLTIAATLVIIVVAAVAWVRLGDSIVRRAALARDEISSAIHQHDYRSDTGARIGMAIWAMELFRDHPLLGVGGGSFRPAAQALLASQGVDPKTQAVHDHAHNAILHIAATTGLAGLIPALLVVVLAFRNAISLASTRWRVHGAIEWAPAAALAGLLIISVFDPVHLNAQTSALLAVMLSLCPSFIPESAHGRSLNDSATATNS